MKIERKLAAIERSKRLPRGKCGSCGRALADEHWDYVEFDEPVPAQCRDCGLPNLVVFRYESPITAR